MKLEEVNRILGKKGNFIGRKGDFAIRKGYNYSLHRISNFCVYYPIGGSGIMFVYFNMDGEVEYIFKSGS